MAKTLVDYISEDDYPRFQELVEKMDEGAKAAKALRGGKTVEEQIEATDKKIAELQAKLDALRAKHTD